MNAKVNENMKQVDARVREAVAKSVARGVSEREAFTRHMLALASQWPTVAAAYMVWLAK